jgi:V8-like Glu-specific endopeptidase
MKMQTLAFAASLATLLFAIPPAQAQQKTVSLVNPDARAAVAYWTPERFKAAQPLPMPQLAPGDTTPEQPLATPPGMAASSDARPPSAGLRPQPQRLFVPDATLNPAQREAIVPSAAGSFKTHYTSSRVFPLFTGAGADYSADRAYPYITVGKLFFTIGSAPYFCSASVIQRRIVVTAGHCVHSGTAGGYYNNWVFVPAYRDGTAPLLAWHWRAVTVTDTWAAGGGGFPNAADYAMIEFADQSFGGYTFALGDVTGWLGWQTLSLSANHTSKLGYPCNLDACQRMQIVTSSAFRNTAPNNVEYGSDARGGSNGGPWVQNFQVLQAGGGSGSNNYRNRVVGVTSYIYRLSDPQVQGASIPDGRWTDLFNTLCRLEPGNCL